MELKKILSISFLFFLVSRFEPLVSKMADKHSTLSLIQVQNIYIYTYTCTYTYVYIMPSIQGKQNNNKMSKDLNRHFSHEDI
jgi:hypothetical protein